jgi:hypothetical protein
MAVHVFGVSEGSEREGRVMERGGVPIDLIEEFPYDIWFMSIAKICHQEVEFIVSLVDR